MTSWKSVLSRALLALTISVAISLLLAVTFTYTPHLWICVIFVAVAAAEAANAHLPLLLGQYLAVIDLARAMVKIQQTYCSKCLVFHNVVASAHGRNSKAILAVLITSLLSSCRSWLPSVVSDALKRPPHVPLCYSFSCPLSHTASFNLTLFSASCSLFCLGEGRRSALARWEW